MQRSRKVLVILGAVLLIGSLAAAGTAVAGTWYSASVGQVKYDDEAKLNTGGPNPGYGMLLLLKTNQTVSVIYSIPGSTYDWPVFYQHKVRWVRVNAYLMSPDVRVTRVDVYDGNSYLGGANWGWPGGWKNGYHDIYVDLGTDNAITKGLRLVVTIQSGTDISDPDHLAEIHAASARID